MVREGNLKFFLLSLIGIPFLIFFNAIFHPFVHDDVVFILQNPQINHWNYLSDIFLHSSNSVTHAGMNAYYRPILELFYRLEYRFFGPNPAAFHFVNIFFHIANGLLLFILLLRLSFSKWMAYGVSLLFLIHPIQSESVACIAGISNILSGLFVLLMLYAYVGEKYFLAFLSFALALLTKEQMIAAPILIVLIDWYRQKKSGGALWFIFALIALGFLWIRTQITGGHMLQDILNSPGELRLRILSIPRTIIMYVRMVVLPLDLHYYRNTDILKPNWPGFIVLGMLGLCLTWIVNKWKISSRGIIFGAAWFIVCLLPVLNIIPIVNEYSFILTPDHFLYLPMIGIVLIGALIAKIFISSQRLKIFSLIICLGLGLQSIYQNTFWRGEIPLFNRTINFEPNFGRGHMLLAQAYLFSHQKDLAIEHYNRALDIMKGYRQRSVNVNATQFYNGFIKEINFALAQCSLSKGKPEEALSYYNEALRVDSKDATILNNMAICYLQMGDKGQAEQYFKMALGLNPTYTQARDNLNKLLDYKATK